MGASAKPCFDDSALTELAVDGRAPDERLHFRKQCLTIQALTDKNNWLMRKVIRVLVRRKNEATNAAARYLEGRARHHDSIETIGHEEAQTGMAAGELVEHDRMLAIARIEWSGDRLPALKTGVDAIKKYGCIGTVVGNIKIPRDQLRS